MLAIDCNQYGAAAAAAVAYASWSWRRGLVEIEEMVKFQSRRRAIATRVAHSVQQANSKSTQNMKIMWRFIWIQYFPKTKSSNTIDSIYFTKNKSVFSKKEVKQILKCKFMPFASVRSSEPRPLPLRSAELRDEILSL